MFYKSYKYEFQECKWMIYIYIDIYIYIYIKLIQEEQNVEHKH